MSGAVSIRAEGRSLPDLCARLFAYVLWLRSQEAAQVPEVRVVYQQFDDMLREFDTEGQKSGASPEQVRLVLFALVAFVDEMILTSKLALRAAWTEQPLQMTYFNENAAGEEFYSRLDDSRQSTDPSGIDVHESFYLCLSLGFKGRFGGSPKLEKQRRSYMEQLATDISAARGATGALSQHVAAVGSIVPEAPRRSLWRLPLMAMAIFVVAVVILNILVHCLASKAITVFA